MASIENLSSSVDIHRKIALVIGISKYEINKSLPNAVNDANNMAKILKLMEFIIHGGEAKLNLTCDEFESTTNSFIRSLRKDDMVLFYFAGHGTQWEDQNYLIPSDDFKDENNEKRRLNGSELRNYAINAQHFLNKIDDQNPYLIMFFLDCCRTYHLRNADLQKSTRGNSTNDTRGLSSMSTKNAGSLIAFACAPGTTADDGNDGEKNGLFTKYLLKHLPTPNEDIEKVLRRVRKDVMTNTNKDQIPHVTSILTDDHICLFNGRKETKFQQNGTIVAGGNGRGSQLNQFSYPNGIFVDENKTSFIADYSNHRIVEWKYDEKQGQIIGSGNRVDQLNRPSDVIVDQQNHSIIIADHGKRRVMRCSRDQKQEILIENIDCYGLTIDQHGFLYVSDCAKNEVRKWKLENINENKEGTLVAGGNGEGDQRSQLNFPTFIFVNKDQSLYVSDYDNRRVMKWRKDANEGIVVAGGNGQGNSLNQLNSPQGLFVDEWNQIYVTDYHNHRIMRWCEGDGEGSIVVGGNGFGSKSNQLDCPVGLSFDFEGNLYVSERGNNRIVRFDKIH